MTYDSPNRTYHIGTIAGDAEWDPSQPDYRTNFRRMTWQHQVERDKLSPAARNSLGSSLTIFEPSDECADEIMKLIERPEKAPELEAPPVILETEAEDPFVAAMENSRELIKDKMMRLSWQDMQALVAGILRAMGYKTKISPEGADRGKDVIASPDGLGLEQPRIFVEVKHRRGSKIGAPDIRKFIGGRDATHDRCLYVSTGGFANDANYEAERSRVPLTLINSDDLVALLLDYYETCDTETRALIPLRRTYWPT
jgi:restriction system protein